MARSRLLAGCLLITPMFVLLHICLDGTKPAMGYYLLLAIVDYSIYIFFESIQTGAWLNH